VNLVWGLESFHRAKYPVRQNSAKLEEKINSILNGIGDKKDRNWLAGRLTHANEPALETRILDIIESLPLDLNKRGCRQFAKDCAARRNELSHFGGQRQSSAYNDFLIDLHKKSDALQYLYHTLLLQNLGLDTQIVRNYIYGSNRSFRKKSALVDVGLLDKGVLKVPALPVPNRKAALPEKRAAGKRQTSPAPNKR
jgi:ApeA N-terminal domain 1